MQRRKTPHIRYSSPFSSSSAIASPYNPILTFFCLTLLLASSARAAFIPFQDCLPQNVIDSFPRQLQWVPIWVDASFTEDSSHRLQLTTYGNVTGQSRYGNYPPPDSSVWKDKNNPFGKITNSTHNTDGTFKISTLFTHYNVLNYSPYINNGSQFCDSLVNGASCPLGPAFYRNASNPKDLPAFLVSHDFGSSYAFASFQTTITVQSGEDGVPDVACISAIVTPDLGPMLSAVFRYLPAAVLIIVAIATVSASIFSSKGSTDVFRWTSNYGREEELLRLVTPGFGDCLQYIQFIVLSGSLSLSYPGFFQPVVSKVSWSALMFNESFASHGPGTPNPVDGIYATNGTYGMDRMSQLVGMTSSEDVWACMVIWALVILGIVILACQIGFLSRWLSRYLAKTPQEDLRHKNWPFTGGNLVRVVCNFLLLPIVALSMFQLLVTTRGPAVLSAFAAILLIALVGFAGWLLRVIFSTKPRSLLFDDLPTVLLYGPLYNTYSDEAAPFAIIPALLTFIRGIAIGAVQPSGIAQLVILAICEVNLVLTLYAFRPFHAPTSMNAYHTFFAVIRLVIVLLQIAFVPSLGLTEAPKGWIGYVILLLHAIVIIFAFFLNAVQTLIEVIARRARAGRDDGFRKGGFVGIFGMRQLSKRAKRSNTRISARSDAAMLAKDDDASFQNGNRSRSLSASSAILLSNRPTSEGGRISTHLDRMSSADNFDSPRDEAGAFTFLATDTKYTHDPTGTAQPTDPYYRPPRPRRPTGENSGSVARSRGSWTAADLAAARPYEDGQDPNVSQDMLGGLGPRSYTPIQGTPGPVYLRAQRDDPDMNDARRSHVDYAVREVDFYYGVRGPALNNQPTRKLKTGPADPVGPVSSATGWFRGMLGWKTKDKAKGFEVVRSTKAAPIGDGEDEEDQPRGLNAPYQDAPPQEGPSDVILPGQRTRSTDLDPDYTFQNDVDDTGGPSPMNSDDERELADKYARKRRTRASGVSDFAPTLDTTIDSGSAIELPSRFGSVASNAGHGSSLAGGPRRAESGASAASSAPTVPRKSSQRHSRADVELVEPRRLSTVLDSPSGRSQASLTTDRRQVPPTTGPQLLTIDNFGRDSALTVPSYYGEDISRSSMQSGFSMPRSSADMTSFAGAGTRSSNAAPAASATYSRVPRHQTSDSISSTQGDPSVRQSTAAEVVNADDNREANTAQTGRSPTRPDSELVRAGQWPLGQR